jgi:hypothetical protein
MRSLAILTISDDKFGLVAESIIKRCKQMLIVCAPEPINANTPGKNFTLPIDHSLQP